MTGISQTNLDTAAGVIRPTQDYVLIESDPAAVVGCPVDTHYPCPDIPSHCAATMAEGEDWITINGISVCFAGHKATCGHAATGRDWIGINA